MEVWDPLPVIVTLQLSITPRVYPLKIVDIATCIHRIRRGKHKPFGFYRCTATLERVH